MVVWGGSAGDSRESRFSVDGAAYDPVQNKWRTITKAPFGLASAIAVHVGGTVVVGGGSAEDTSSRILLYSVADDHWESIEAPSQIHDLARLGKNSLLIAGIDSQHRISLHELDLESEEMVKVPVDATEDGATKLGLAPASDGSAYAVFSDDDQTFIVRVGADRPTTESYPLADFDPPVDLAQSPLNRGAMWYSSGSLYSFAQGRLSTLDPSSGDSSRVSIADTADYCGVGAHPTMDDQNIFVWGGRNCSGQDTSPTERGIMVSIGN